MISCGFGAGGTVEKPLLCCPCRISARGAFGHAGSLHPARPPLRRLTWIDREAIATIALDALGPLDERGNPRPQNESFALEPDTIWKLLGGLDGLEVVERNCRVLVDLATYLQRYYPEALVVAEQLRLNAREIEWHVGRLKGAARTGNLRSSFTDYAQRAVVTYYRMPRLLLALGAQAGARGLVKLQQAIWAVLVQPPRQHARHCTDH